MSKRVFRLPDGSEVEDDKVSTHVLCDRCGEPAEDGGSEFYMYNHFSLHPPRGVDGPTLEICRDCLKAGFNPREVEPLDE